MLELKQVKKSYKDKQIFSGIDLTVEAGQIVLLMGKSGIGKSTLLDMIAGVKSMDDGSYHYRGNEIFCQDDKQMSRFRNRHIGYILQDFALIDDYTVLENLLLPALYRRSADKSSLEDKARQLADQFEVSDVLETKVKRISGGQKQRAAIIRSILLDPDIILADEPTSNLDADNFQLVIELFNTLKADGKIIIIATHDDRLTAIADKVYQISDYRLKLMTQGGSDDA
ncbi:MULTISPECIES: ABC transporter ATP-binding protein [unclassified Streptococcus]|uniref:ABC transporter ATP-binding protein n=1 Tax=unclassified Streptococcus TaxID=2608887 RepID=UPI00359D9ACE